MYDLKIDICKTIQCLGLTIGDYTLASGVKSKYYVDLRKVMGIGVNATGIGQLIWEEMQSEYPDCVGGMETGAIGLATSTIIAAYNRSKYFLNSFFIRKIPKGHGTERLIEGNLKLGDKVVIVEDVTTTGESIYRAIQVVEKVGGKIIKVITVIDREENSALLLKIKKDYNFASLFTLKELQEI